MACLRHCSYLKLRRVYASKTTGLAPLPWAKQVRPRLDSHPDDAAAMKIALSLLCENPQRKTGLTTTYHEFVGRSLKLFPDLSWVVFVGPNQEWRVDDPRVEVVRSFPANDRIN